jgi:hypothetical protein
MDPVAGGNPGPYHPGRVLGACRDQVHRRRRHVLDLLVVQLSEKSMKYVLTWWERPTGSYADYEAAQKRVLGVFQKWEMPSSLLIHQFLVRVGEYGGYAVIETDNVADIHKLSSTFAIFKFRLEPVLDVMDAVGVEAAAIAWRDSIG